MSRGQVSSYNRKKVVLINDDCGSTKLLTLQTNYDLLQLDKFSVKGKAFRARGYRTKLLFISGEIDF